MSKTSAKTFDTVHVVRALRDEVTSIIAMMSVEEENRTALRSSRNRSSAASWSWLPNRDLQPTAAMRS
jgi:hypothetical protein